MSRLESKQCLVCSQEFMGRVTRKYCSRTCFHKAREGEKVAVTCVICGKTNLVVPSYASRKTCGGACRVESIKRNQADQRGEKSWNYKHGRGAGKWTAESERRWAPARAPECASCGAGPPSGRHNNLALHHVVDRNRVEAAGGDIWDPRNALTLCNSCHSHHHKGGGLSMWLVPDAAVEFAIDTLGDVAAFDYFAANYVGLPTLESEAA